MITNSTTNLLASWLLGAMLAFGCVGASASDQGLPPVPRPEPVEPVSPERLQQGIDRAVAFLLDVQNEDGSWGSHRNTKPFEVRAPVPGSHYAFRAGVTSLCVMAMIEAEGDDPRVTAAINRGEAYLFRNLPTLRRIDPRIIYNTWGHAYGVQALAVIHRRHEGEPKQQKKIARLIAEQIDFLERFECVDGGWCYYDFNYQTAKPSGSSISFVSATVLIAFDEARSVGVEIPRHLVDRAIASIHRQRKSDFSYCYGEYLKYSPMSPINRPAGSLGRSQACNVALRLWDDPAVSRQVLVDWLDRIVARNLWLDIGRKRPIPHESHAAVAGYFYYYGHYYAGRALELVDAKTRRRHQDHLATILLDLQEKDGCWWDYPLYDYHRQYGTAFALMTLHRCRKE